MVEVSASIPVISTKRRKARRSFVRFVDSVIATFLLSRPTLSRPQIGAYAPDVQLSAAGRQANGTCVGSRHWSLTQGISAPSLLLCISHESRRYVLSLTIRGDKNHRTGLFAGFGGGQRAKNLSFRTLPALATAQRLRTECGPGWSAALPGVPCAAVSRGRQAAQREPTGCRFLFDSTWMYCRKARPRLTDLPDRSPASAKRGGLSLWLLSLWPRKEKVTRAPTAHESSCV
jgi:hypothetical protein